MLLKDFHQNVAQLKGLGAKACENLHRLGIQQIGGLLQHYPFRYLDHREPCSLTQIYQAVSHKEGYFYCRVQVQEHQHIHWRGSKSALKVMVSDGELSASLLCFGRNFLAQQLTIGREIHVAGKFQIRYGQLQSSSFSFEVQATAQAKTADKESNSKRKTVAQTAASAGYNGSEFGCILPIYPLTQGLTQKQLRNAMAQALQHFSFAVADEVPIYLQRKHNLLPKKDALRQIHFPESNDNLAQAHRSLVYEELLIIMLLIQRRRLEQHSSLQKQATMGFSLHARGSLLPQAQSSLPFELSPDQSSALEQILQSFTLDVPMNRLLQGDVGSGKTIVALLSTLPWLEQGAQVVLMAPTEILAKQLLNHFETLRQSLEESTTEQLLQANAQVGKRLGQTGFLSGSVSGVKRREVLRQLRTGEIRLLVGTHALFSQAVEFANLRYIIVDEQHRFGVEQRLALKHKAPQPPHLLLMSATPIPRTLALTLYGDLEISSITTMPKERKSIKTHLVRQGNDAKMYAFIQQELLAGRQVYFIYPLISTDNEGDSPAEWQAESVNHKAIPLRSIEQMQRQLEQVFSNYKLAIVHGQMAQSEKDQAMAAFRANEVQILLATTVVEVGVDVPNASVIAIEHAERFGLAQLHQLRGRVGRGTDQGYCFLVYQEVGLSTLAKERLLTLKDCSDGFAIAEKDLELRGPGDLLGSEQSGSMELRIAKIPDDLEILERARLDTIELLNNDYALLEAQHQGLRQSILGKGSLNA